MTQHITQATVKHLWQRVCTDHADSDTAAHELCNAAIQHYIDQQAKGALPGQLPVLPKGYNSIPWDYRGNVFIESQLRAYGQQCAAHAREAALSEVVKIIEAYRIPVGNSASGELACEWTYDALKEIRDEIKALKKAGK